MNYLILTASRREFIVHKTLLNCISCYKAKQLKLLRKQFYQTEQQLQSLNSSKDETILQKSNVLHYNDNSLTLLDECWQFKWKRVPCNIRFHCYYHYCNMHYVYYKGRLGSNVLRQKYFRNLNLSVLRWTVITLWYHKQKLMQY